MLKKAKGKIILFIRDLYPYLGRKKIIPSHKDFSKFIILTRSRSGSTMLLSYLMSHPNIHIRGEILQNKRNRSIESCLNRFFSDQPKSVLASGFKIFYYHPLDDKSGEVWDRLTNMKDLKIIHLKRQNLFKVLTSRKIANLTGVWGSRSSKQNKADQTTLIELDAKECENFFKWNIQTQETFRERFSGHDIMEINYEDFVKDSKKYLKDIQNFLNLPMHELKTKTNRQQKRSIREVVRNYDEVKNYFENTQWAKFFK